MSKEIEIKLTFKDKEAVLAKLKQIGATFRERYLLHDMYLSQKYSDMKNAHDLLRIRRKGEISELTFKGKVENDSNVWERVELTTAIDNAEVLNKIFNFLDFKIVLENKSIREYWDANGVEIVFISLTYPVELEWIEIEAKSNNNLQPIIDSFKDLVEPIGEDYFKKIDEAREKNGVGKK